MHIQKKQFEKYVSEAIESLPERFQGHIHNLAVFIEDYPSVDHMEKAKISDREQAVLFGLYEGNHQAKKINYSGPVFPDRITIFQKPIEDFCQNEEEIKSQIFKTVRHEIAHHFGSDEVGAEKASQGQS